VDGLLNEARAQKLVTDGALHAAMARCPGRRGTGPLRALLEAERETGYDRSQAERLLRRLIKAADLEPALHNVRIEGKQVDAVWPRYKVVLEVDGYQWHGHRQAFERDRGRDQKLIGAGYIVIRVTWRQLTERPMVVAVSIAKAMARRSVA
jgi:very-short-patch-repair endonuclease